MPFYIKTTGLFRDAKEKENWFAGYDHGSYGSGMPTWLSSSNKAQTFSTIEKAQEWYTENKRESEGFLSFPVSYR